MAIKILAFKKTIAAAILGLAIVGGIASQAYAGYCQTTCTTGYGGTRTCNTWCY